MRYLIFTVVGLLSGLSFGQESFTDIDVRKRAERPATPMTAEKLIQLGRVFGVGMTDDGQWIIYGVSTPDIWTNKSQTSFYKIPLAGGEAEKIRSIDEFIKDKNVSPDGRFTLKSEDVKMHNISGTDYYPELGQSNVMIYNDLNYRHWDTWEDGAYSHVFIESKDERTKIDLMENEPYDCPQKPFGGDEDYIWSPDGKQVLYVTKKSFGTAYAVSTNSDIYSYDLESKETTNLTAYNKGYDNTPSFSSNGTLAYLQMKRDGYESDKNDIVVVLNGNHVNITKSWDGTVASYMWSKGGKKIFFTAAVGGTVQLFEIEIPEGKELTQPVQLTDGQFDVRGIVGHTKKEIIVARGDMNHASELFVFNFKRKEWRQLTHVNDAIYNYTQMSNVEKRMVKTTDDKEMVTWVIYPPNFDPNKKYPTLLYCQGGPQGALSQFYSFRWNFQLMAANGYIIVAPNRRGMPGFGVEWNEQISGDYGGQNMKDYLAAIDAVAKEPFVDNDRLGCIGASYGGYSVFYLAAIHEGRFKSFISHDGIFDWKSMYGTTEEMFFVNWDLGGSYWDTDNPTAQKSYNEFNPVEHVAKWNTPIMIIQGGKDFRVPIGQGLEAFQAAQLQGIKSRLLFFPEENHWVLDYQNSLIWHTEFYKWLDETL